MWYYQNTPGWTDDTAVAASGSGSPFTVLAASTDYMYFGYHEMFNKLQFLLSTVGSYGTLTWGYSQGSGNWGTVTVTDGTSGFTQIGAVTLTPPSAWAMDAVNSFGSMFWLRVSAASVTTTAKVQKIQLNPCFNCILFDPLWTLNPQIWDYTDYELTLQQVENPNSNW